MPELREFTGELRDRVNNVRRLAGFKSSELHGIDMSNMDLVGVDLHLCDLTGADFSGSNLRGADLYSTVLDGVNFTGATLTRVNLKTAVGRTDLSVANLVPIKNDLFRVFRETNEAVAVLDALRSGRVDGRYYRGECACLLGTIGTAKGFDRQGADSAFDSIRNEQSPIETWFTCIRSNDTPETNQVSKITEGWVMEWLGLDATDIGDTNASDGGSDE